MSISCSFILQIPMKKERKIWYQLASNHFLTVRPTVHSCQARWETDRGMPSLVERRSYSPIPHLWTRHKLLIQIKVVLMYSHSVAISFVFGSFKILIQKQSKRKNDLFYLKYHQQRPKTSLQFYQRSAPKRTQTQYLPAQNTYHHLQRRKKICKQLNYLKLPPLILALASMSRTNRFEVNKERWECLSV